jgi:hypothetical protein
MCDIKKFLIAFAIIATMVTMFFIGSMNSRLEKVEAWQRNVETTGLMD